MSGSGEPLDEGAPEPPAEERPDRDVALAAVARQDEVEPHPQLLERREEVGRDERPHPGRQDEAHPVGQSANRPRARMRTVRGSVGRMIDVAEAELAGQLERPPAGTR